MQPEPDLAARFERFVSARDFPCVGAKSALGRGTLRTAVFEDLCGEADEARLNDGLLEFVDAYRRAPQPFQAFAAIFRGPSGLSEASFEAALWARLQGLSDRDARAGHPYDPRVSARAGDPRFSFSLGGEAMFVVGLHPGASRPARRFEAPVLVFNPHDQFEQLRAEDRYDGLREAISARDVKLAGARNPMLAVFGERSEARQYSGRQVDDNWRCPFRAGQGGTEHGRPRD